MTPPRLCVIGNEPKDALPGVGRAGVHEEGRTAALKRLLRWVRATRRGSRRGPTQTAKVGSGRVALRVPPPFDAYHQLDMQALCRLLVNNLDTLEVDGRGREALVRYFGLIGPPEPLNAIAGSLHGDNGHGGLGIRRVQVLIRHALEALAYHLPDHPPDHLPAATWPPPRPPVGSLGILAANRRWRRCFHATLTTARGQLASRRPPDAPTARGLSVSTTLDQWQADVSGTAQPTAYHGRPIRPWLRYRLRNLGWAALCAANATFAATTQTILSPGGTRGRRRRALRPPRRRLDSFEDRQLGRRQTTWPQKAFNDPSRGRDGDLSDPEVIRWLLVQAEQAHWAANPRAWDLLGLARDGLAAARFRQTGLVARALNLQVALTARSSHLAALRSLALLQQTAGPLHPFSLQACLQLAAIWSLHGRHGRQVLALLRTRTYQLFRLPAPLRDTFYPLYLARQAATLLENPLAPPTHRVATAQRLIDHALHRAEQAHQPAVCAVYCIAAQVAAAQTATAPTPAQADRHVRHGLALVADARHRFPPPPSQGDHHPAEVAAHGLDLRWALANLQIACTAGDQALFRQAEHQSRTAWSQDRLVPAAGLLTQQVLSAGATAFGLHLPPLEPPNDITGWSADFSPPPYALPRPACASIPSAPSFRRWT